MEFEIRPEKKFSLGIRELINFYELLFFFTWRDIKVKYKQTMLGVLWAVLQPLFMALIFTYFLGNAITSQTQLKIPYALFALSGLLIWGLFSSGLSGSANSMVNNANIIKKIYFPRLIIPLSAIIGTLIDFFITLLLFIVVLLWYKVDVSWFNFIFIPVSVIMAMLASTGLGIFLAALNVKYRDVRYILPFFIQGLLFLSPVIFPVSIAQNNFARIVLQCNPIAGALELARSVFTSYEVNYTTILLSSITSVSIFIFGLYYFRKTEAFFADLA